MAAVIVCSSLLGSISLARPVGAAPTASGVRTATPPSATAARPGKPASLVAVGDSITQATGTGALGQENPKNSWATGTDVNSVAARLAIPTAKRYNPSANGDRMSDFAPQIQNGKSGGSGNVAPAPADTGLVVVQLGGNDLCKDSVASMTPVETYRAQFNAGLARVGTQAPNALLHVLSVPDIYNLWYIRGAPQNASYHPESESGQATGLNGARFYWDGLTDLGVKFPCQSLLANPASYSQADRDRRAAVRTRTNAYNAVLAEECDKVLRCRFDDLRLFNLTSNRSTPPDGPLLPQGSWAFTDLDISRNTASLCPIPGLVGGGCGDHFHPSKQGQAKVADSATASGRDWTDTTYPTAGASLLPSTRPDGLYQGKATVRFAGSDAKGLRGQEVRVHNPDGTVTPWSQHIGVAPNRVVDQAGRSYAEVRSLDVNGNLSASVVVTVDVLPYLVPGSPTTPTLTYASGSLKLSWGSPSTDGGLPVSGYEVSLYVGTPPVLQAFTLSTEANVRTLFLPWPASGALIRYRVQAVNGVGRSSPPGSSVATVAPFTSLTAFVTRQYQDFAGRAPTGTEALNSVSALTAGTTSPSAFIDGLRASTWFDGAYGPSIRLYRAYFLRNPDPSGLDFWANRRRRGQTLDSISQQFSASSEFKRRYGSLTNAQFIDTVYNNVFGRDPDAGGRDFYLRRLQGGWSRGRVVLQFSESSEYKRLANPIVTVVQYARGMNERAPSASLYASLLSSFEAGGSPAVLAAIAASATYRTRIVPGY